ncbi:putative metal-binding motif-containing protein [Corallococcus llansteffanensis]|uniref:Lipoprotein n=1 Tax=Corallococcus llansteffanensis TaxID=2316731 RepID=A0A3A8PJ50_9BACT|nr:putative metal-binding motif-containing protein [Corallococcus llansteffanensis]RKH55320.1 hypothetical protein D7V93_23190 [Corallococcus llansteffanensis]
MMKMKRIALGALLSLGLMACGPMEEPTPEPLFEEQDTQALEASCTSLGTGITTHACVHSGNPTDHLARTASATRTTSAPAISTKHKAYDLALPSGAEGSVTYVPATTGSYAFYRTQNVPFTVINGSTSATVAVALSHTVSSSGCSLVYVSVHDLTAGTTYIVATGPASGNALTVVPEFLDDSRTRYYQDADGDGYGNSATSVYTACTPPSGYTTQRFDCNDTPVSGVGINPGATEVCGNGIDDNCDGSQC